MTGLDFDPADGHREVQFSFASSMQTVRGGLAALSAHLDRDADLPRPVHAVPGQP